MSSSIKFARHPSFPQANTFLLESQWFWKMTLREWAFGLVDVVDGAAIDARFTGATNNVGVVRPKDTVRSPDSKKVTIRFFASVAGPAFVYLHDPTEPNPFVPIEDLKMQVEVTTRRAAKPDEITLTKLEGTTAVINSPDTKSYTMDSTNVFRGTTPLDLFAGIPAGANHVVVGSHGAEVNTKVCMFVGGIREPSLRLGLDNCEEVFKTLRGKVAENCVVWLGGCAIGSNNEFCHKAAMASGCPVVAAGYVLANKPFPKGYVDILDRLSMPKYFPPSPDKPGEIDKPGDISDFCFRQDKYKFVVPV